MVYPPLIESFARLMVRKLVACDSGSVDAKGEGKDDDDDSLMGGGTSKLVDSV